jgi:cytochrome c oxidase cbb3-type subunit 2
MQGHEAVEKNVPLLIILIIVAISFGTLVELTPLIFSKQLAEPIDGLEPYSALELEGRDIYIREGCNTCHSQMVRPLRAETERYGHYSVAGEFVYDRPFLWGSKRTGPDLARVGQRYSATTGTARTCTTRATWYRSPTCRPSPGFSTMS